MCQWWVLLRLELVRSDLSGVDTAILFIPTMHPCMISSLSTAPLKMSFVDVKNNSGMSRMSEKLRQGIPKLFFVGWRVFCSNQTHGAH